MRRTLKGLAAPNLTRPLCWQNRMNINIDEYSSIYTPIYINCQRNYNLSDNTFYTRPFKYIWKKKDNLRVLSNKHGAYGDFYTPSTELHAEGNNKNMGYIKNMVNTPLVKEYERKLIKQALCKLKTTLGVQMYMRYTPEEYKKFLGWVKKHDKSFRKHITKTVFKPYYTLKDQDLLIKVGEHTYARILTGESLRNDDLNETKRNSVDDLSVGVYIFGKEAKKIAYRLDKIRDNGSSLEIFTVTISQKTRNGVNIYRDNAEGRSKDSVFLNDHIKDTLLNHVRKFFNNKEIYDKRNLTYKTGILLEGEPGTGKSTIANMIATEFNCSMVIINMNQFSQLDTDFITSTLNADDNTYVVLLEDIDCVIGDRESEDSDVENKKNVNKLLQFLDSASSPSNVIFVATTNHIEKLDDAIVRDGRFDLKVNISNINREAATQMCKSFGIKDEVTIKRIFEENSNNGKINPAKLQNLILKEIDNKGE